MTSLKERGILPLESSSPSPGELRRNYLGLPEAVAQAIGTIAPSASPALVIPAVFAIAGSGTWLAYVFATIALLFVSWSINQFASRSASPGSLYVFAARGLGPIWGVIAGWSLVIAYLFTGAAVIGGSVSYLLVLVREAGFAGHDYVATIVLSIILVAIAWLFAYRDIKLSTRTTLVIEASTVTLIIVVLAVWAVHSGRLADAAQLHLTGVTPDLIRQGLVLAFFSFVGFESVTTLGAEVKDPFRVVPRALVLTVLGVGIFLVASGFVLIAAFEGQATSLAQVTAPLDAVAHLAGLPVAGTLISAGVALSFFACLLGSLNAGARVLFSLARHGLFHGAAGGAHSVNATPHVAISLLAVIALVLSVGLSLRGIALLDGFGYLGTVATFGFIVAYLLVAIGAPVYLHRQNLFRPYHALLAVITVILLAVPLIGSIYPSPAWPFSILPVVFLVLIGIGVAWFFYLRLTAPHRLLDVEHDLLGTDTPSQGATHAEPHAGAAE